MGGLRVGLLKGLGASLLVATAACGGRSSTLYPDAITNLTANQPSGGSTGKPGAGGSGASPSTGTGGATSTGGAPSTGGTAGAPTAGTSSGGVAGIAGSPSSGGAPSGGSAGLDPTLAAGCKDFCNASTQGPCATSFEVGECMSTCISGVSGRGPQCQMLISSMLSCLKTANQAGNTCDEVNQLSVIKCAPLLASNPSCFVPSSNPPPEPPPEPAPTCSSSGSSSNGKCTLDVKCTTGAYYTVSCYQTGSAESSCTCNASLPNGTGTGASFGLNESATFACYDSLAACGFPQIGAK